MTQTTYPNFKTAHGYMTESVQRGYIAHAIEQGLLPAHAHRMAEIISLDAPNDPDQPIQFWQIFSVIGPQPIVEITRSFYEKVFWDEEWFRSVFARVGGVEHHVATQASMWADCMGAGPYYHGAEFRLNFHHYHNAMALMNDKGAERWATLMRQTLDERMDVMGEDARIRPAINTFLTYFFEKYAADHAFSFQSDFGPGNPVWTPKINLRNMTDAQIEALDEGTLRNALAARGVTVAEGTEKAALVAKATAL